MYQEAVMINREDQEFRMLILHLRKRKWRYLAVILTIGISFFFFLKYEVLFYKSIASFFVNESVVMSSSGVDMKTFESISLGDKFTRTYELINSAKTRDHLIKKFHLAKHYGIDTTREFYYEQVATILRDRIQVKKNPFNTIIITVYDKHRYLAADMANEILEFVERLNQEAYINNIRDKMKISETFVNQLDVGNQKKIASIDSLIRYISNSVVSGKLNKDAALILMGQQQKLNSMVTSFQLSTNDLVNSQKLYLLSLQALNFKNFPTTTVVQTALPAARSIAYSAFLYSILVMVLVAFLLVLHAYLFIHYKDYIHLILKGDKSEQPI